MTARMDPRSDRVTSQNPLGNGRLVCEWKQTADKRGTCTWTLRDATPARLPDLPAEDSTPELLNCVRSFEDRIAIGGQDRFLVWIWQPPRRVRTILGMAAAVFFLGLATAYLSRSTTANSRQTAGRRASVREGRPQSWASSSRSFGSSCRRTGPWYVKTRPTLPDDIAAVRPMTSETRQPPPTRSRNAKRHSRLSRGL